MNRIRVDLRGFLQLRLKIMMSARKTLAGFVLGTTHEEILINTFPPLAIGAEVLPDTRCKCELYLEIDVALAAESEKKWEGRVKSQLLQCMPLAR